MRLPRECLCAAALALAAGCGSSGGEPAPVDAASQPDAGPSGGLRVEGLLVSTRHRVPVPFGRVWIDGVLVHADGDGRFTVDVDPPYDAATVNADRTAAILYLGVTRADPTLELDAWPPMSLATLRGTLSGGAGYPQPYDHETVLRFQADRGYGEAYLPGLESAGADYEFNVHWPGAPPLTGTLCAVQKRTEDLALLAVAYAEMPLSLTPDALLDGVDLTLAPVGSATLSGEMILPADWTGDMTVATEGGCAVDHFHAYVGPAFSITTPVVDARTVRLQVRAVRPDYLTSGTAWTSGLAPDATDVALEVPQPPVLLSPPELTTVRGAFFEWSGGAGGLQLASFSDIGGSTLTVLTADRFFRMPDLSSASFALRGRIQWYMTQSLGYQTTDEAAAPDGGGAARLESIEARIPSGAYSMSIRPLIE